jgi:hypothetical protein
VIFLVETIAWEQTLFERVLLQMRGRIRTRKYVVTLHAEEEMNDDDLSIFDVESVILTGEITERQKEAGTAEWKYLVKGRTLSGDAGVVLGKLSFTGKLVIITVYRE